MCEEVSFLDAESLVGARCGALRRRTLFDDPRVADYLTARDATPWRVLKGLFTRLTTPAAGTLQGPLKPSPD